MNYRHEIDGLRAIAVVSVVLFHVGLSDHFDKFIVGGYLGVDIFFAISGYLITSLILSELKEQKFSLLNFYIHRIRRILPALLIVMLACIPAAWLLMQPHQLKDFGQSLVASNLFSANILFFLESGYFEPSASLKPLLHTWSLAVEEQFYIVFPFILLLVYRWPKILLGLFFSLAFLSFYCSHYLYPQDQYAAFYLIQSRAWELVSGGLCALLLAKQRPYINGHLTTLLSLIGLALIIYSITTINKDVLFPSYLSIAPVLGTMLVILFSKEGGPVTCFLSLPLLSQIGLISYSAYLIHQPLLAFSKIAFGTPLPFSIKVIIIVATFSLAVFSYCYIESPFRNKRRVTNVSLITTVIIATASLCSIGYLIHTKNGFIDYKLAQIKPENRQYLIDFKKEKNAKFRLKSQYRQSSYKPFSNDNKTKKILILGDSVSYDLYLGVQLNKDLFRGIEFRHQRLDDTCYQYLNLEKLPSYTSKECLYYIEKLHNAQQYKRADIIVFSAVWQQQTYKDIKHALTFFAAPRREFIFIGSANFQDMQSLSYEIAHNNILRGNFGTFFASKQREDWKRQNKNLQIYLNKISKKDSPHRYYSKYDVFCEPLNKGITCPLYNKQDQPLIYDTGHVTVAGAQQYGLRVYQLGWFD